MSEISLMTEINKNVRSINNNTKHFGTKMPADGNLEKEMDEQGLTYSQMIMGSLASLVWGKLSVKDEDKVKSLLGSPNNIYTLIEDIKTAIDGSKLLNNNTIETYFKKFEQTLKFVSGAHDQIERLYQIVNENLKNNNKNTQSSSSISEDSINRIIEAINTNKKKELEIALKGEGLDQLKSLLEEISKFNPKELKDLKGLNGLYKLIESLSNNELTINSEKAKKNLNAIKGILTDDKNQECLRGIFDALSNITKGLKINENIEEISTVISSIGDFFVNIDKLNQFDDKQLVKLKHNLEYIKEHIIDYFVGKNGIVPKFIEATNGVSKEFANAIKSIDVLLDRLFKIVDISFLDLIFLNAKLNYLSSILEEEFIGDNKENTDALLQIIVGINKSLISTSIKNIDGLGNVLKNLNTLFNLLTSIKNLLSFSIKLGLINLTIMPLFKLLINNFNDLPKIDTKKFNSFIKFIENLLEKLNELNKFTVDEKLVNKIENITKLVDSLKKLTQISIIAKISSKGIDALIATTKKIKELVNVYADIKDEDLKKALNTNKQFTKLLVVSAAILIAGGLFMAKIKIVNLLMFTAALAFFTFVIAKTYKSLGKNLGGTIEIAQSFMELIAISGLVLIAGSLFMKLIDIRYIFSFTLTLSLFLFAVTGVFKLLGKSVKENIEIAKDVTQLIEISAAVLLIGGLFMKYIGPEGPIAFAVLLGGFILGIVAIFTIASRFMKGSLLIAKEFSYLIAISALSLILGALFVSKPERAIGALVFAILLDTFIWFLLKAFSKHGNNIKKAIPTAMALGIVTILSSFALLISGGILAAFPKLIITVPLFGVLLWGFTVMMCKVLRQASKHAKDVMMGAKIMAIIGGLVVEMGLAFRLIIETSKMIDDWIGLLGTIAIMGGVILGLYMLAKTISNAGPKGVGMLAIATAILAGLIGCISLMGIGIQEIAKGMEEMARVSHMDVDLVNLASLLLGLAMLTGPLMALGGLLIPIGLGAMSMKALKVLLSDAAKVVQAYASLKIPMYDDKGQFTGFKVMSEKDIQKSMDNMKAVVTALFYTIKEIYDKDPDMFSFSLTSLLTGGGGTVFGKVAAAGKGLAVMLSMLAVSVQQWCDLKIPIYEGEKIIGYKTIDNDAFVKAGKNIQAVVTCLGQSVLDVYNNAPEDMFDYQFGIFGDSPFEKVSKSLLQMGKMLAVVADGVEKWSELKIPVYKNNSTEIQSYITLTNDDFVKAGENIKSVVTCLAGAVMDIYDEKPELFESDGWFGLGSSKFSIVSRALGNMGTALGSIANGVKEWSDLKIPVYKGKEVDHYLSLTDDDFVTAGENVGDVVSCLAQAIIDVYEENPTMFDGGWFTDSPFTKVVNIMGPMGKGLKDIAEAVQDWADLKIPIYKDGSTEIESYLSLSSDDFDKVGENVDSVVTCLISSVASLYEEHDDWFKGTGLLGLGDSPIAKVLNSIAPLGSSLKDIADAVQAWADLKIPIYGQDDKGKAMITGYITMGDNTFAKVSKNIDKVVTSLIRSVAALYFDPVAQKEEWFDGTGLFGLGDSPIGKVLGSIVPLGKTLKDIADAIQAWADLKIPVYGVGPNGEAQIQSYKTLASSDFAKATKNINKVVTSLVRSIAALYFDPTAKKEGWFDGGWFLGKSPISKVLTSIEPLGNVVAGIAEGVTAFAEFKIPIYGVGKDGEAIITGYHTLADNQIVKAGKNIGKIVKLLAKTIGSLYYDKEAQKGQWFDKAHWWSSGTPFSKVITALEPMGNMVGSVAEGVKNFADLKVPIYGKNNKGELAIVGYKTLADGDFDTATYNIGKIIMTLGMAIGAVVKKNPGVFDSKDSPVKKAAEAIKLAGDTLSGVAGVIGAYASGKFPTLKYDSKGKLVPGAMVTLDDKNIEEMKKRVNAVITALGQAIIDVYNEPKNKSIFDSWQGTHFKQDAPAAIVAGSIKGIADALKTSLDVIAKIIELDFNKIAKNMNAKDGLVTSFKDVIRAILAIYGVVSQNGFWVYDIYNRGTWEGKTNIAQWMNQNSGNITILTNAIKKSSDDIKKIFESIKSLYESYNTNKKALNNFINSSIVNDFKNINASLIKITTGLISLNTFDTYENKIKNAKKITEKIKDSIKDVSRSILKINDINKNLNNISFDNVEGTIKKFISCINSIKESLYNKNEEEDDNKSKLFGSFSISKLINTDKKRNDFSKLIKNADSLQKLAKKLLRITNISKDIDGNAYEAISTGIKAINTSYASINIENQSEINKFELDLERFIFLINSIYSETRFEDRANTLRDGILNIYSVTKEIETNENFKRHTSDLEDYIRAINKVDLSKLMNLQIFVNSLNMLSRRLGNLDDLTDAIANRLSSVLFELVQQLTKADASINNAHQLQEKRKKLIEESMQKISTLMNQHMIVEISQLDPTDTSTGNNSEPSSPGGNINGKGVEGNESYESETPQNNTDTNKNNPENANIKDNQNKNQQSNNYSQADLNEFKRWMLDTYTNTLVKKIKE